MALRDVNAVVTITTNAVKAIDDGKKLKQIYADINEQLNLMKSEGKVDTKEFKDMQKLAEDTKAKINEMLRGMELIDKVMGDISGHIGKDLNRALRETSKEFNKTSSSTDEGKAKLEKLRDVVADLKRELSDRRGLTMSLKDAEAQLKNLDNASLDKLRQGLAAVREEAAKTADPARRAQYQQYARNYEAQIAIKEHGNIGSAPATGTLKSEDRLRAETERQRLVTAYQAASRSDDAAHKTWAAQALKEIQQYNSAIDALTEKERKEAKAARDTAAAKEHQQKMFEIEERWIKKEKVSLAELIELQKSYQERLKGYQGQKMSAEDERLTGIIKNNLHNLNEEIDQFSKVNLQDVFNNIDAQPIERLEAALKQVKEDAAKIRVGDTAGIDKAAQQMDILEKKIAEVKARMTEYSSLAERGMNAHKTLANIENASYEDLENTLKFLEERHKKLQGTETKRQQQSIANQDKIRKRMRELRGDLLSEEEIRKRVAQTGKYSATQLQQAYDSLKVKLMSLRSEETEAIKETRKQMKLLQKEIDGVQGKVSGLTKIWTTAVRNIGAYVGVFAGFNYVKGKLEEVIKKNYELSDSLTNVRKVSGLTMDDINQLYTNISKIDTRNTINTLTDLAYQGGKLGIQEYGGVEALTGFVKAAEQVQAALGEDLGEDALPALAKLTENMGLIKSMGVEEAMQKTASAIFALSTSSVSTGTGIVDFSKRLMPVAKSAGVATSELLGLASATESSGLAAEVASTAFVKMFPSIYKNADALETYLGISKGVIREMYDQNRAMDAMVMIFDKMQDMGNLNKYPEIFKLLGSEGARMNTVMSAMANNVDMLRTHLNTSNKAFEEGTAVINEYNLQTNSAAGILERANNIWEKAFVNPEGVDMVKELAEAWYILSKHVATSDTWMTALRTSLKSIETIVATLIYLLPALIRIMAFYGVVNTVKYIATNFWDMRKAILAAAGAQGKLNAAMRANAFSILITLGLTLVSCFWDLYKIIEKDASATKKLSQEEKDLADAEKMVADNTKKEVGHLNALYKAATDTLQPMEKRMQWVQQLKKEFPDYFKDLTDEAILTGKAADKYEALAQSLMKAAKARAYQQKMDQISEESVKLQEEIDNDLDYLNQNQNKYKQEKSAQQNRNANPNPGAAIFGTTAALAQQQTYKANETFIHDYEQAENRVLQKQAQIGQNDERIRKLAEKAMENTPTPKTNAFQPGSVEEEGSGSGSGTKELNAEYRDEQQKAKDIINKVKNYYQRQINAIKDMAAVGTIDEQRQKDMVDGMQQRMNEALSKVRKAIGGVENDWEDFRETMINDLYEPLNEKGENWSTDLVKDIVDNDLVQLRKMIQKLSDTLKKDGSVLLDEILRKATEDEGKNVDLANKRMRERQQELRRKNYTEQVDYDYIQHMDQFGIGTPTAEQDLYIQTMSQQGNKAEIEKFFNDRNDLWREGFLKARENLWQVIDTEIKTAEDGKSLLQIMYGDNYETVLKGSGLESLLSMQLDQWQVFYQKLIEMSDAWDDAQEKAYQEQKKRNDKRFENLPDVIGLNQMDTDYGKQQAENARWGKRQSIWERAGLGSMSKVTEDPEIKQYEVKQAKAQMYYEWMQRLRDQNYVSEEMLMDAKQKWADAQMALQDKVAEHARQKMEQIQQLLDPIKEFGAAAGDAMYLTVNGLEGEGEAWRNAVKNIIKTYGEMTIQMIEKQLLQMIVMKQHHQEQEDEEQAHQDRMKQIQNQGDTNEINAQNVLNAKIISTKRKANKTEEKEDKKAEDEKVNIAGEGGTQLLDIATQVGTGMVTAKKQEADQTQQIEQQQQATSLSGLISDTVAKVVLGIAGGSAKTISELGWWGLPLVAVISAALMGLLNFALSSIGGGKGGSEKAAAKPKVKLASGMLTYDSGNVQTVVGDDGRVYRAREQRSLPEGVSMVTEPIATRVNGQQALVGERGPEIVIGRRTTRAIQMNRPDLLRDLALIDRGITTRKVRTFDEGNISDMASAFAGQLPAPQPSADGQQTNGQIDTATADALRQLPAAMAAFAQVMGMIQKDGIPANLNMFGDNGAYKKFQQADKFYKKYGG